MSLAGVHTRVILATLFWGANFVLAGPVLQEIPPLWAAALRFTLAALILLGLGLWRGTDLLAPARAHAGVFVSIAAIGVVGFNLLFFWAMQSTSPTNGALIMATNPLMTTLIAFAVLAERPTFRQWLALPLAFVGVAVVISHGDIHRLATFQFALGDLLMLSANLAWAFYNVLCRRYMPAGSPLTNTTLVMIAGASLLLMVALTSGESLSLPTVHAGVALLLMATAGTVLAYLFWMTGIARLGAGRTSLFLNLVPVFAALIAALLGVAPTLAQVVGGLLVIGSVSVAMLPTQPSIRQTSRK